MPWLSLAAWLVTFLISSTKKGVSAGKAAMIATGVAAGTYFLADPSNEDNFLGIGQGEKAIPGDVNDEYYKGDNPAKEASGNLGTSVLGTVGSVAKTAVSEVGQTVRSWGPTGTLAVVAGTTALASDSFKKWLPWIAGGAAVLLLTR